jgi:hypothetical protein
MSANSKSKRAARKSSNKAPAQAKKPQPAFDAGKSADRDAELFARGVTLFNSRYFFEAHEAWEEIWLHTELPEKTFLQGLIQVTAAFHHHSRENLRGTKSLLRAGLMKLEDFAPHHRGINIEKLREVVGRWLLTLDGAKEIRRPGLPRIAPAPVRR